MNLRPGLKALEQLVNSVGVTPLKDIPDFIGTADLYLAENDDEKLCLMEGLVISLALNQRVKREGILADAFVLVVRRLGPRGDVRRDPRIPENFEAKDCSHIVLWSLENPENIRRGSFAKISILDVESVSKKSIWLSECPNIKSIYYPII